MVLAQVIWKKQRTKYKIIGPETATSIQLRGNLFHRTCSTYFIDFYISYLINVFKSDSNTFDKNFRIVPIHSKEKKNENILFDKMCESR